MATLPPLEETISKAKQLVSEPITSSTLSSQKSFDIVDPAPSTAAAGMLAGIEAQTNSLGDQLKQQRKDAQKQEQDSYKQYVDSLIGGKTETGLQATEYAKTGGVDDIQKELDQINADILAEQVALRHKKENIDQNGGGLQSGAEAEKRNLERDSLRIQADLSVKQMMLQGRYDSAKKIADRAIDAILDEDKKLIEARKLTYERNKELFDKTEQREFDLNIRAEERKLEEQAQEKKDIKSVAIDYLKEGGDSATADKIMNAKTLGEAMSLTGNMLGLRAKLERQKLVEEINKIVNPPDANALTGKDKFQAEVQLSDKFNQRTGDFVKAQTQIENVRAALKIAQTDAAAGKGISASSQALITGFNKILDPTSVVRESEYARSAEGLSVLSRLEGQYTRLTQGGAGVTAVDLAQFADAAEAFMTGYENSAIDQAQLIIEQSAPVGLDVTHIIPKNVLGLMEDRFTQAINNAPVGGTFMVAGKTYKKVGDNDFQPI